MEIDVNNPRGGSRRRHSQLRLLEKQIRSEIFERCLQFIDVIINQIIYQENIYPSNLFISCQMYKTLVYKCIDNDISSYIILCAASLRDLFSQQLSDMISINIIRNFQIPIILRRYLIELHTIHDPCLRAIYDNRKQLINQIDQAFAHCIQTIKQIKPLENHNFNKQWTFQFKVILLYLQIFFKNFYFNRLCSNEKNNKGITIGEILRKQPIYKEFLLINQQSDLLSNGIKLQYMCKDDKYEQEKFQQSNNYLLNNISIDQQDTNLKLILISMIISKKSNESELWLLTTTNNPPICTIDDQDMKSSDIEEKSKDKNRQNKNKGTIINADLFIDHYHLTQRTDRENFDALQYSSEDEDQPQSPYSPDNVWQEEDNDEDEDL
ncbi:unnamed protein product [Rotaria sordida]|uniref:HORMA domain-containing protein n=2 Tax=Rotaria sordida TaxID=392033 RepID=A0A814M4K1_9BILA|nr:unnamed protein product [Rotaria sordida]CAF1072634.1 unnamed protein product [Rotaria sordida]